MKNRKIIAWLMTLVMVLSVFGGGSSAVFATGEGDNATSASAGFLSEVSFASSASSTAAKLPLKQAGSETDGFDADVKDYIVSLQENNTNAYVWATLSEAGAGATITAKWQTDVASPADQSASITSGATSGTRLTSWQGANNGTGKVMTLEVVKGDETQVYTFTTQTTRTLSALSVTGGGKKLTLSPAFSKETAEYTVRTTTANESVVIAATPSKTIYKVTADGQELTDGKAEIALGESLEKTIPVKVEFDGEDNSLPSTYQITVRRSEAISASFQVTPGDALIYVEDAQGQRVLPEQDGTFILTPGESYDYTVTKAGYVGAGGQLNSEENINESITLEKAAQNTAIKTDLPAAWKNFRGSDENMAITSAPTPKTRSTTELKWVHKKGTDWSNAPCVQIIVNDKVITLVGDEIYQLNSESGEVEKKGKLAAAINWGYTPPTYADGMIFCPLAGGTVQAVNAETLESLWVYRDPLGGQALSPITYQDGYLYTGFWNSETADANYVCLSATDENPEETDEAKLATWRYTQQGGFYWAGSVVIGDVVVFGTDDGTGGSDSPTSKLLSVDRLTGKTVSSLDLIGDQRSTIAYDKSSGRVYGTTKAGYFFSAAIDAATGKLSGLKIKKYASEGTTMSTSTPVVYKGVAYFGYTTSGNFGGSGYSLIAADADTLEENWRVPLLGYPQCSALLSTAYEETEGKIYLYMTYNNRPGGVTLIKAAPDAADADEVEVEEIYDAKGFEQYCITSIVCDEQGTLYYKNDSCSIFALASNSAYLEDLKASGGNAKFTEDFESSNTTPEITVDPGTSSVELTILPSSGSSVMVEEQELTGSSIDIPMESGKAEVQIKVLNGEKKRTYTVQIRERSQDATLKSFVANESNAYSGFKTMTPTFDAEVEDYAVYGCSSSRSFMNVWPELNDSNAAVKLYAVAGIANRGFADESTGEVAITSSNGGHDRYALYFDNGAQTQVVKAVVTAEDGKTTKTYFLTLSKRSAEAEALNDLKTLISAEIADHDVQNYFEEDQGTLNDAISALNSGAQVGVTAAAKALDVFHTAVAPLKTAQTQRDDAAAELTAAVAEKEYDEAAMAEIDVIQKDMVRQMKSAESSEDIETIVSKAKLDLSKVKTVEQVAAEKLENQKKEAMTQLRKGMPDLSKYRMAEQVQVLSALIEGQANIESAEDEAAVEKQLAAATDKFAAIKTDADYKTAAMASAKITVTAKASGYNAVNLSWTKAAEAEKYEVYRATSQNGAYQKLTTVSGTSWSNTSLTAGTTYYYKVRASVNADGKAVYSNYSAVSSARPVLTAVTGVKATAATYNTVKLSWNKVTGAKGYAVYRATSQNGSYRKVGSGSAVSYTDKSLATGTTYYYKVKAYVNAASEATYSSYSAVSSAKPVLSKPASIKAKAGKKSAAISWSKVSGASGYQVYRATKSNGKYTLVQTVSKQSTVKFTNKKLKKGKTYYYKVRAYRKVNGKLVYSGYTKVVKAKAK